MLAWADVRQLLTEVVGPHLLPLGFTNPGRAMWRYRPVFVDVVRFECRGLGRIALEFGCGLRAALPNNPAPWDCPFRVDVARVFGWPDDLWAFRESADAQRAALGELARLVPPAADTWFGHFATPAAARRALDANTFGGPGEVAGCRPGSPAYLEAVRQLEAVRGESG